MNKSTQGGDSHNGGGEGSHGDDDGGGSQCGKNEQKARKARAATQNDRCWHWTESKIDCR